MTFNPSASGKQCVIGKLSRDPDARGADVARECGVSQAFVSQVRRMLREAEREDAA